MAQRAELVSTGAELLNGRSLNRHGQVLGSMLKSIGITLQRDTTVIDDRELICEAVKTACNRADFVFVTGGLGPTDDDLTREGISDAVGRPLVSDPHLFAAIEALYTERGREFTDALARQAQVVEGGQVLPNPVGFAPGQSIEHAGSRIIVLPGPPQEFLAMMQVHVMPWLHREVDAKNLPHEKVFMVCGMGESDVHQRIDREVRLDDIDIAYCAAPGRVEVTLQSANAARLKEAADQVRGQLASVIYAEGRQTLEDTVAEGLKAKNQVLAVAESCTGGMLGGRLTAIPGSSAWFSGGVIAYANAIKESALGVRAETLAAHGAVSEATAREMAVGVRSRFGSDFAISITGVAGPDGGTPDKPVGLVFIGLAWEGGEQIERCQFGGERGMVRERSVQKALEMLWRRLGAS